MRRDSHALIRGAFVLALVLWAAPPAQAQGTDWSKVAVKTEALGGGVSVLFGAGGNIGVFVSPDGILLVDDQFAPLTPKIRAAVKTLSTRPVKLVLNTHWHGDHVGGNVPLAEAGATIIAQDNVRKRMTEGQVSKFFERTTPPAEHAALPVITFARDVTLHLGEETIQALHVDNAHTDGDVIVKFEKANVIHMGDTYFSSFYPIIDLESGGSINGMIAAVDRSLPMIDVSTKVIAGHGPVGNLAGLTEYRAMLAGVRDAIEKLVKQNKSLEEVVAAHPTAPWDEKWGKGYMKPDKFTEVVYNDFKSVQQRATN
jgi:glyoxylase-like metal-dependent hydrolase (beta-lactamase superfamily II)